ncbi:hypothetical protein B0T21DRAFT_344855 [Apiosordaria backusii]|uniref:Uncharacterized protein n=1 Tax=Apiosordaria backusii TaxID=314023 RepID=A0AA40K3W2_9PEZI|nr:hypothetical protein B0T21DRAFT_344855 [Apiosordaria backusii]
MSHMKLFLVPWSNGYRSSVISLALGSEASKFEPWVPVHGYRGRCSWQKGRMAGLLWRCGSAGAKAPVLGPDGFIKDSFPLHIDSLGMLPDPTEDFVVDYRWLHRRKLWITDGWEFESLPQYFRPRLTIAADRMLEFVEEIPGNFKIYGRVDWSTELVISWNESASCFMIEDLVECETFKVSKDHVLLTLKCLHETGKWRQGGEDIEL